MNMKVKNSRPKSSIQNQVNIESSDVVGSYEKHPFFIKKMLSAKSIINDAGLPKQLSKKLV